MSIRHRDRERRESEIGQQAKAFAGGKRRRNQRYLARHHVGDGHVRRVRQPPRHLAVRDEAAQLPIREHRNGARGGDLQQFDGVLECIARRQRDAVRGQVSDRCIRVQMLS
jgi:hypothetical protein